MSKHPNDEPSDLHFEQVKHSGVQYEDRDLGARGIIAFLIVLGVSGLVLCLIVWGYFDYHAKQLREEPTAAGPQVVTPNTDANPLEQFKKTYQPAVPLQTDDVADMNRYREQSNDQLGNYGYVDQKAGVVHIPIEQAMDQLVKQGLPTRPAPTPQAPVADFGSGKETVPGAGGGTRPLTKQ